MQLEYMTRISMATYQLDFRHPTVKIQQTFSDRPNLVPKLVDYLQPINTTYGNNMLDRLEWH